MYRRGGAMNVIGNYYVEVDGPGYMLRRKAVIEKGKNAGQETWIICGYYYTLPQALDGLLNQLEREGVSCEREGTLNGLVDKLSTLRETWREDFLTVLKSGGME